MEEIFYAITKIIITFIALCTSIVYINKIGGGIKTAWIWLTITLLFFFVYEVLILFGIFGYFEIESLEEVLELMMSLSLLITVFRLKKGIVV